MSLPSLPTLSQGALEVWRKTAVRLLRLGGDADGNELVLFIEGDSAFETMLAAIKSARRRVWLETYIFAPDRLGLKVLQALTDAAGRGVDVRLLVDDVGSDTLRDSHVQPLRDAGATVVRFNPGTWSRLLPVAHKAGLKKPLPMVLRDHRKIVIIDDEHGFCGGMNISEDYGGKKLGNNRFRDTHVLVSGPAVRELGAIFGLSWQHATGTTVEPLADTAPRADGSHVQILGSDGFLRRRRIQSALYTAVQRSHRSVLLTTPYFIPPPRLLRALRRAAARGVDVRVLTAGVSDVPIAAAAARHLYGSLLESGVRVYELQDQTLHAKTAVVDGFYAHIGSFNLDRWSFDRNLEVVAMTLDPGAGASLERVFLTDLAHSVEVDLVGWRQRDLFARLWGRIAWFLCRL
jgi:cardiolipin synthase